MNERTNQWQQNPSQQLQTSNRIDELLNHLGLPDLYSNEIEKIKHLLHERLSIQELEVIIDKITGLVVKASNRYGVVEDALTGLPNRIAYSMHLTQAINRWQRGYGDLCIAIVEIDYYKQICDALGRLACDSIMKKIGDFLRPSLRTVDFVGRYGDGQYVIVFENTTLQNAMMILNKLRVQIQEIEFQVQETMLHLSCSFGITQFTMSDEDELATIRAEEALLAAKANGCNQVQNK